MVSPSSSPGEVSRGEGASQGKLIGRRVEEDGASEGHPVMGWIGIERVRDHATSSHAKPVMAKTGSEQTSIRCLITREYGNPSQEGTQDDSSEDRFFAS